MQIWNHDDSLLIAPDGNGGYIVSSNGKIEGRLRKQNDEFEYESEKDKDIWTPCGKSISEAKDFIFNIGSKKT